MANLAKLGLKSASVLSIVALSVLTTLTVQHLVSPLAAAAQGGQPSVVRAAGFEVVGPDGNVLARLTAGPAGNGNLMLLDTAGNRRTVVAGNGTFGAFDADGVTLRYSAGYSPVAGLTGTPPINGIALGPDGTVGILSGCTGQVTC